VKRSIAWAAVGALGVVAMANTTPPPAAAAPETPPSIVVIFMENHRATDVLGNPTTPYENRLAARGTLFTNYQEPSGDPMTGPSLPDYLAVAAGSGCGKTSDDTVPGDPSIAAAGCTTTLWNQLQRAGISWAVYEEGMPRPCAADDTFNDPTTGGTYALKHNPATPFPSIWNAHRLCRAHVLPFSRMDPSRLPAVSFVAPNLCDDQHGSRSPHWRRCEPGSQALMQRGDRWLAHHVPAILAAGATVFLTYDESGPLYAVEVGHGVSVGLDDTPLTHYSILAGIEALYRLPRLLGAADANAISFLRHTNPHR
jgi:phosphatidylinositol-3-phosphatase